MGVGVEGERAGLAELAVAPDDRPAGEDIGELGHVGLRIAGADAHRVQFEDLAREVLVEARAALLWPAIELGPIDCALSRKFSIAGMLLDRAQHVGEAAEHVRADRLALERAGGGAADAALGDRDAEMIRPERDQPFDEADRRRTGLLEPRLRFGAKELLLGPRLVHHRSRRRRGVQAARAGASAATLGAGMPSRARRAASWRSRSCLRRQSSS